MIDPSSKPDSGTARADLFFADDRTHRANDQGEAYFEIYRATETRVSTTRWVGGKWHWRFCTSSGVVIAESMSYETDVKCHEAVDALRRGAGSADIRELT